MPSTGEGFGIVFLEAMAAGIRTVGGAQDGSLDALGDGVLGTPIKPENREELVSAINAALDAPKRDGSCGDRFEFSFFTEHVDSLLQTNLMGRQVAPLTAPNGRSQPQYHSTDKSMLVSGV
jgi:glycosyltransferase involved in cell wall biosynthesis